jgi:C4-dicarboxylate transporter, DcuC family
MIQVIMYISAIVAVLLVFLMLIKKMDIKITLLAIGIILMYVAVFMGKSISMIDFKSTGLVGLDPILAVVNQFKTTFASAGLIILLLGGYSAYMTAIGANDVTVNALIKPIGKINSPYLLVPVVFLLANLLSLVVPSASNLAIILLATLYPVLRKSGMSVLTAAAVIATSATIIPTPLGSDNVAIAQELAKTTAYTGMTATSYVLKYHAIVSIPILILMAVVHYFWQKRLDKKSTDILAENETEKSSENLSVIEGGILFKTVYAILPLLPIILLVITFFLPGKVTLGVDVATLICFAVAIICELIRNRNGKKVLSGSEAFFKGMGSAFSIVALLVAASIFVVGLQSIGLVKALQSVMTGIHGSGMGFVLPLIMVGVTVLIVILSGSGTALFFAMIPLIVPLAAAASISPIALSIPMGLAGNLMRAVSPVSAVVVIVAGAVKKNPLEIVKRTSIPMIAGLVLMFVLSMILFIK